MKKVVLKFEHWYPKMFGISAITMGREIWFSESINSVAKHTLTHEMIHIRQIREIGWKKFYSQYLKELAQGLMKYQNYHQAYVNISFEREAFNKQFDDLSTAEQAELDRALKEAKSA